MATDTACLNPLIRRPSVHVCCLCSFAEDNNYFPLCMDCVFVLVLMWTELFPTVHGNFLRFNFDVDKNYFPLCMVFFFVLVLIRTELFPTVHCNFLRFCFDVDDNYFLLCMVIFFVLILMHLKACHDALNYFPGPAMML